MFLEFGVAGLHDLLGHDVPASAAYRELALWVRLIS